MPGEHIDKIVNEAVAKLNYVALKGEALEKATPEQKELDDRMRDTELGTKIFNEIESSSLSPQEKQEAYQRIVKAGVQGELDKAENPATLLRGNSPTTRFMTEYMNTYAKGYMESVYEDTLKEAIKAKSQLPESLQNKKVNSPFGVIDGVNEEDQAKLYEAYRDVAKKSIQSTEENLSKLSPEARAFMQASLEPTGTNKEAMNMATASTLLLRGASAMMARSGGLLRDDPETQVVGNLLLGSNVALQTYVNTLNKPVTERLDDNKPQNKVCNELRTDESLTQTKSAYQAISEGSDKIDEFVDGLEVEVEALDEDLSQEVEGLKAAAEKLDQARIELAKEQEMRQKLRPFNNRIKELEDRKNQLETNPSIGDRIKCFFKHGFKGVNGEIEKIDKKIEATTLAKDSVEKGVSMDDMQKNLERLKVDRAEFALAMEMAKSEVTLNNAARSVNMESHLTDKQVDKSIDTYERAKVEKEALGSTIKQQEKVLSVREKLGPKEPKQDGPKQGKSVGVS
jgi:hypothetical protein